MLLLNMRSWVFLIFFILLSLSNSHALELFGYKLYDGIDQYINDGEVNFKKKLICISRPPHFQSAYYVSGVIYVVQ